ncbi:hypothetical protein V6N13_124081 [Hibiscus sabdariffa]
MLSPLTHVLLSFGDGLATVHGMPRGSMPLWLHPIAFTEAPPLRHVQAPWLRTRTFAAIGRMGPCAPVYRLALVVPWLQCGIAQGRILPSPCYLALQDALCPIVHRGVHAPAVLHSLASYQGTRALRALVLVDYATTLVCHAHSQLCVYARRLWPI